MGNEQQITNGPGSQIVMHEIKVGCFVVADRGHHGLVCTVGDGIAEAGFLTFKLIPESASGTGEIAGFAVGDKTIQFW